MWTRKKGCDHLKIVMKKYSSEEKLFGLPEQDRVMNKYKTLGFVKDKRDEQGLHMAFSPQRVPEGLTKLQVRRRINNYYLHGGYKVKSLGELMGNRLNITINGKQIAGISFTGEVPKNMKQFVKLLKSITDVMAAPKSADKMDTFVLGKYSPK